MGIVGLQHASITVSNLERSIEFYSDILGMDYLGNQVMPAKQVYDIFGLQGVGVRYAWLRAGRSGVIELFEFDPPDETPAEIQPARIGHLYFALQVRHLDSMYRELMKQGVKGMVEPMHLQVGTRIAFIKDPDGLIVELIDLGLYITPKIKIFGGLLGWIDRLKRKRSRAAIPTGACSSSNDE